MISAVLVTLAPFLAGSTTSGVTALASIAFAKRTFVLKRPCMNFMKSSEDVGAMNQRKDLL